MEKESDFPKEFSRVLFEESQFLSGDSGNTLLALFREEDTEYLQGRFLREVKNAKGFLSENKIRGKHLALMALASEIALIVAIRKCLNDILKDDDVRLLENVDVPLQLGYGYLYSFISPYHGILSNGHNPRRLAEFEAVVQRNDQLIFLDATISKSKSKQKSDASFTSHQERVHDVFTRSRGERGFDLHKIHVLFTDYQEAFPEYQERSPKIHMLNVPLLLQVLHVKNRMIQLIRQEGRRKN